MKQSALPAKYSILRDLGPLEELYWQYGRATPFHFAIAAEIEGETEISDWRKGLDLLQRRHPLFSVSVYESEGKVPAFISLPDVPIPLRVAVDAEARWEDEMAKELSAPFDTPGLPLVRAVLLPRKQRSVLILVSDHAIADGISLASAFHDLLQAIAQGTIAPLALTPPFEELAGAPRRASERRAMPAGNASSEESSFPLRAKGFLPKISGLRLTPAQTESLTRSARLHETTLQGALCAALIVAGRKESRLWQRAPVRILSPMNLRSIVGLETQAVLAVGVAVLRAEPNGPLEFWELARSLKRDLAKWQSPLALTAAGTAIAQLTANGLDRNKAADFMIQNFTSEGMVTNLGRLSFRTDIGNLRIKALWGPAVLTGVRGEQVIGAGTLNGSLHLLHTSPDPFPSLLETMARIMLEATYESRQEVVNF